MDASNAPGHPRGSTGRAVKLPTDSSIFNSKGEAITRNNEAARQDTKPNSRMEKSRQNGRTSSFPLAQRPARTSCYPSKGAPGAHVSKATVSPNAKGSDPWTSETADARTMVQRNHHQNQDTGIFFAKDS